MAWFYNEEKEAVNLIQHIANQYTCMKDRVNTGVKEKYAIAWTQADMTTPQVYEVRVDTYAKTLINDAAANMIQPNSAQDHTYDNSGEFHLALRGADMLLDTTPLQEGQLYPDWLTIMNMVPGASYFYDTEGYYKNRKVYRTDGLVSQTGYSGKCGSKMFKLKKAINMIDNGPTRFSSTVRCATRLGTIGCDLAAISHFPKHIQWNLGI